MRMRNVIWPVILAATLFLSSCNREEKEDAWQQRIRQVSELGTVQYTVQKVVSNSDETWQIFGNRKILFSFKAIIKAGIDMDKFDAESVRISVDKKHKTKSISLVLPQPEVLSYNICPDDVKMIYNQVSFLRTEYSNEERNAIQRKGDGIEGGQGVDGYDIEGCTAECGHVYGDVAARKWVHECEYFF